MELYKILLSACCLFVFCGSPQKTETEKETKKRDSVVVAKKSLQKPKTVGEIPTPEGFKRVEADSNSFGYYLRNLKLKQDNNLVYLYNGSLKFNQSAQHSVIVMDVGKRDLQQCADAVMRLRAEFLYGKKMYDDIHFKFTNGTNVPYRKYANGYRVSVKGNKVSFYKKTGQDYSYKTFRRYMDLIFMYAGTFSLSKELKPVGNIGDIKAGDVFIQGGFPGHAVTVMDVATDKSGKKVFMLSQSYMPAQEIHILKNPNNSNLSPWYSIDFGSSLVTPEWTLAKKDLKRFE